MQTATFQEMLSAAVLRGEIVFMGSDVSERRWIEPPGDAVVLALAPHPDDPDSVAVTLGQFARAGCRVHYLVACSSHGGVTDAYAKSWAGSGKKLTAAKLRAAKQEIRRQEQLESARAAGFVIDPVIFLDLQEDDDGNLLALEENAAALERAVVAVTPDIVVLPFGEDTNRGHAFVYNYFHRLAPRLALQKGSSVLALYNRDPKTMTMKDQLVVPFGGELARWKAGLLSLHRSQQERNMQHRGHGFDERILRTNREIQRNVQAGLVEQWREECPYAESFQVELFR